MGGLQWRDDLDTGSMYQSMDTLSLRVHWPMCQKPVGVLQIPTGVGSHNTPYTITVLEGLALIKLPMLRISYFQQPLHLHLWHAKWAITTTIDAFAIIDVLVI